MGDLVKVLKPLQIATTALCEAEIVSVSLVYPIIHSLITKHLFRLEDDMAVITEFKMVVTQELQQRFKIDDIVIADKVPILAAALDPRYLHLPFLSVRQRSIATGVIKEKCQQILQEKESVETGESEGCSNEVNEGCGPPSKRKNEKQLFRF